MCHLISVVSAYIFGAVRNLKSTLPAVLFLLVSSFAVTAQANVVFDFEGYTANYQTDDPDTLDVDESTLPDGTYTIPDGEYAFPAYGGVGSGIVSFVDPDDSSESAVLVVENGVGGEIWGGVTIAAEYVDSDFVGDGSSPVTMRVFADQDGDFNFELEADGQTAVVINQMVSAGWNDISIDVSSNADINWHKIQIRPDQLAAQANSEVTKYFFDDISFPNATIVQAPAPTNPSSAAFLAGATAPTIGSADVLSLFSGAYDENDAFDSISSWSQPNTSQSELTIDNANVVKRYSDATFVGYEGMNFAVGGYEYLNISLYRQDASNFEIKLVDTRYEDADGNVSTRDAVYYIENMVANEWVTVQIPMADFSQSIAKIDQVVIKPMGGAETFYLDDFYFSGVLPTTVNLTLDLGGNTGAFVYINSSLWSWVDDGMNGDAVSNGDGTYTYTTTQPAFTSFEYQWYVDFAAEDLTTILAGSCNESLVTLGYAERVHVPPAEVVAEVDVLDTFGECHAIDTDGDEIPNSLDPDDDNDGVEDANDWDPLDANFSSQDWEVAAFQESFGGTTITGSAVDGDGPLYTFPTSTADAVVQDWAGFANQHTQVYPLYFTNAGSITFNASVPLGGSAEVRFKLEKNPHPDVNPSYDIAAVTVTGADVAQYTVAIPPQGSNVYKSLLMYLNTRDVGVIVTDVVVDSDPESGGYDPTAGVVTFSVDMNGVQLNDSIPNVLGDFNGYCGGQCAPMTDVDGDGIWTLEITLSASNVGNSYIFALGDTQETLFSDDGAEVACSNRSYYGDVADDGSQAFTLSRSLQFEGDTVLETVPFNGCAGGTDPVDTTVSFTATLPAGTASARLHSDALGWDLTHADGVASDNGDGTWTATIPAPWAADANYKWVADGVEENLKDDVDAGYCANDGLNSGDWGANRVYSGSGDVTGAVFGECSDTPAPVVDTTVSFTATLPAGTASARLHSDALGWDLNHADGVASDNGDGTWTATIPAPWGANANYKWVADGVEENLKDDVDAGYCANDGLNSGDWGANRVYSGSGDVTGAVFGECSDTPAAGDDTGGSDPVIPASPVPTDAADSVLSIFSDAYTSLDGTDFNPNWGQSTQVAVTDVITYTGLNYQGTGYAASDVSGYEYFHVDFYTSDATALDMSVIKAGGAETLYDLTDEIVLDQWVSVNIPLTAYADVVDLTAVNQLKVNGNGTVLFDNLYFGGTAPEPVDPDPVTTTNYCSTEVTHFNIVDHAGSILVTIENSGADSVDVTATSVDDVIDLLIIENVDGGGTASATDITGGVATATISWAAGTMPATASFGMLWSDEAAPGNQMLNKGDGADAVGNIDTAFDCATDHPVPSTPVVPSTVNVTFQVDMSAETVDPTGVYVAGGALFANAGQALSDDDNDGIWTLTTAIDANSTVLYKFRNRASTGDGDWGGFEDKAGLIADGCDSGQYNDRIVTVTDQDVVLDVVAYGSCTATPYVSPIAPPTFTLTNVADSVTAVRMVGPGWNGWDANGGPAATKNDDGTWSVTVDPAPADTWEYKWTLDGVQEILHTPAGNGDCTAEIDAGRLHTDYLGWGNRLWPTDAGDVTDIANACAGTDLTPAPVDTTVSFTATLPAGTASARLHSDALGWDLTHADGVASDNGDGTWTATIPAPWAADANYKWVADGVEENLKDDVDAGYCANDGLNSGDWGANRVYSGSGDVTGAVFGECSDTPAPVVDTTVSFTATLPAGTASARLHSDALGWDLNHADGVASDNGDGTWTATIPAPWGANANYKWVADGVEENLKDDVDAGYCANDGLNSGDWGANRVYSGSGDVTGAVFGECSDTPAAGDDTGGSDPVIPASPVPTDAADSVLSIFSDAYTSLDGTDFNPNWGQSTQVAVTDVITYTGLNYQGTGYAASDVSGYEYFHVDFYTSDATALDMSVIKAGGAETLYDLTDEIVLDQWVSVNIPLTAYADVVDLTAVNQLKVNGNGTVLFDNLYFGGTAPEPVDPDPVTTTNYCSTEVTHFNIVDHAGSILVTIENSGADSVDVTATSVDDVIDLLIIENVDGGGTASATDITGGVATATISWAAGTMPATASFGMLWSDEAAPGNQMLNKGDGADAVGNIDTAFDCATDHPVPSTPVVPSTVNVTFQVDMSAETVDPTGVYVAGGALFANAGQALSDDDNDGIWTLTTAIDANSTVLYKFRNRASTGGEDWGGFEDKAGLIADGCDSGQYNDRIVTVTDQDVVLDVVAYGSCTATPYVSPIAPPTFTLTNVADSVTAVRMVGPGWNGWDANGGPEATKNADGTWSVTVDPAPADTWEYKWTLDGVQENLHTPAGNGDCTAEIDAGRLHTDYSGWGNRLWPTDAGDVTDIANACAGTDLTPAPVDTTVSFTATLPAGTASARLHSDALGWDLNHADGVASDNGDGTWTATIPAPWAADANYKWVADGVEENLKDDVDAGYCANDGLNSGDWGANRVYSGSGDVTGAVFGECSDTPAAGDDTGGSDPVIPASPVPTDAADSVLSIFSDAYTSLDGTDFNPNWGQSTQVAVTDVITYTGLNYQGTGYAASDVSGYEYFHVDFYTSDATALDMSVIKAGGAETLYDLTDEIVLDQWVSVNIPLTAYADVVDLTAVNQLKVNGNGTVLFDNLYFGGTAPEPVDPDPVTTTNYCSTEVTHFNIVDHAGSILVTIENSGADSVDVTATSVDDVIDLLIIENVDGGGTASATDITGGVATATISWAAGTMPATASFGMLWSDEAAPGNQMLNKGDGADAVGNIDTAFDCATDHPVPSTPVVPSTVNVTFQVDMSAETVDPTGVYVAGGALFANAGQALSDDDNDGIWTLTTAIDANSTVLYKFRNRASTGGEDWGGFEDKAGLIVDGCDSGQYNDRIVTVTDQDVVLDVVAYGSCTATPYVSPIAPPTFTLTNVADSVTAVRMVGPGWNGWDANGGPAATKNDDGTWSVTVDPAPADTWEYKWTLDGVQENLHTPAGNGDCTAEIDAGRLHTDYSGWGNRLWPTDAGDVTDIANACAGTDLTPAPVDTDGDGVADNADAFPNDATETADTDSDGTGDNADAFPNDATETADTDSDGTGDNADAFPNDATETADTDSDGTGDNADAFPNDASETADSDNDGVGDNADYAPNDPGVTVAPALPEQQVSVVGTPMGLVGSDVKVTVSYDASNGDDTVTGLGIRLHYDSSVLTFVSQSDVLELANIGASGPYNDDDNDDSDTSTDKYVDGAWASFGGTWPGALPAELFTVTFTVNDVDSASTDINFSSTSTAVGYEFAPTSYSMDIIEGSFDFDGNGTYDALTDGLLFLRYAFDYRGDDATNGVIATDSPKSDAEVLASLETAMGSFGDIDGNGVVDALTDGLLLIRSLFGFTGDALISDAVGDSTTAGAVGDATRTTAAEIQTYIDSMSL